jgi:hypothetical protein
MTKIAYSLTILSATLVCALYAAPAQARARVFVASYGNDANPCTFGSPCKTFQHAVDVVDAGGEVTAIDSAGFGPFAIGKSVTITSPDGVEAGIVPNEGGDGIDIYAGPSDTIVLRGLTIDGSGGAFNGIVFHSGGSLTVTNCVVQHFYVQAGFDNVLGYGILIAPTSSTARFAITNTMVLNNAYGILADANGVVDHVVMTSNQAFGIASDSGQGVVAISNSVVSNSDQDGIDAGAALTSIDNVSVVNNGGYGIVASGAAKVLLGRSVITGNSVGISNQTSSNSFFTYKDNRIYGNITDISSPLNTTVPVQ